MKTVFADPNNIMEFHLVIKPDEGEIYAETSSTSAYHGLQGMYKSGTYKFKFDVPSDYPYKPPKVKCEAKVYFSLCLSLASSDQPI